MSVIYLDPDGCCSAKKSAWLIGVTVFSALHSGIVSQPVLLIWLVKTHTLTHYLNYIVVMWYLNVISLSVKK